MKTRPQASFECLATDPGFCLGLILTTQLGESAAVYERIPGMRCQRSDSNHGHTFLTQTYGSWLENNTGSQQNYVCPIPSTQDLPLSDIATILIDVYDGNNDSTAVDPLKAVRIRLCSYSMSFSAGEIIDCDSELGISDGNPPSATFSGGQRLVIDSFDLQFDRGDNVYLYVRLPALDLSASRISSIYITN